MVSRRGLILRFHFWPQNFAFYFPGYYLQHLSVDSFLPADFVDLKAACVFRWDFAWSQTEGTWAEKYQSLANYQTSAPAFGVSFAFSDCGNARGHGNCAFCWGLRFRK